MVLLCDVPVHELSAGDKQLLQPSRNGRCTRRCYAHLRCGLRLVAGARYLLLGKNGCGKSTLLKAIHERGPRLARTCHDPPGGARFAAPRRYAGRGCAWGG